MPLPLPPCGYCSAVCCKGMIVLLHESEYDAFPEAVPCDPDGSGRATEKALPVKEDGSCVHLDENDRCSIYDRRPRACQYFNCLGCYGLYGKHHGKFLQERPQVAGLIEDIYPVWAREQRRLQEGKPDPYELG